MREKSTRVPGRRRTFLKTVPVPNRTFAGIRSHLEVLRQLEAIGWARIFAEAAEHAGGSIVRERREHFAACSLIAMPANDDQIFRAGQRAKIARDAKRFARLRIHV